MRLKNREQLILDAALRVAEKPAGWATLSRIKVAIEADCSEGLVSNYFGTMAQFRRRIIRAAIVKKNLKIIGQAIAAGDTCALKVDADLKNKALQSLSA